MVNSERNLSVAIENLLLDDSAVATIESRLGGFNIFEAIGHTRAEERHSDFLAFLLDPNGTHGLGPEFLNRFSLEALKNLPREARPLSLSEVAVMDLESTLVLREFHQIDVLCLNEAERFLVAIENKVGTGEHSDQLRRYREFLERDFSGWRRLLVFLTPDHDVPSDDAYAPVSYGDVQGLVEMLQAKHASSLGDAVTIALQHYARMLRRHIVTDDELVDLAKAIYRKHKAALDFIFEQRPDQQLALSEGLAEWIAADSRVVLERQGKSTLQLYPPSWAAIPAFNATPTTEWTRTGRSLLLEVRNTPTRISIALVLGPGDTALRERIFAFSQQHPGVFTGGTKTLYGKWTTLLSLTWVNRKDLETKELDDLLGLLRDRFDRFVVHDLPRFDALLVKAFGDLDPAMPGADGRVDDA